MLSTLLLCQLSAHNFFRIEITGFAVYPLTGCFRNALRRQIDIWGDSEVHKAPKIVKMHPKHHKKVIRVHKAIVAYQTSKHADNVKLTLTK